LGVKVFRVSILRLKRDERQQILNLGLTEAFQVPEALMVKHIVDLSTRFNITAQSPKLSR
jgi:hypothetical protein